MFRPYVASRRAAAELARKFGSARQTLSVRLVSSGPSVGVKAAPPTRVIAGASAFAMAAAASLLTWQSGQPADTEGEKIYQPNEIVGVGFRQEVWKAKHQNINVLDLEMAPIALVLTHVKDKATEGEDFVKASNRLIRLLIENALCELPVDEEAVVENPAGLKCIGVSLEDDVKVCVAPVVHSNDQPADIYEHVLQTAAPSGSNSGHFVAKRLDSGTYDVTSYQLPEDIGDRNVILFIPELATLVAVDQIVKKLRKKGVSKENISVASFLTTPEVAAMFAKRYPDMHLTVCSIDSGADDDGNIIPGIGGFFKRYEDNLQLQGAAVQESADPTAAPPAVVKKRKGWRRYILFGPRGWELGRP